MIRPVSSWGSANSILVFWLLMGMHPGLGQALARKSYHQEGTGDRVEPGQAAWIRPGEDHKALGS